MPQDMEVVKVVYGKDLVVTNTNYSVISSLYKLQWLIELN